MKKSNKNLENITRMTLCILITVLVDIGLISIGLWPIAILVSGIGAIYPVVVLFDKLGIIELVDVEKYQKLVDKNGNVIYDEYELTKKKNSTFEYDKQLRYEEDRKRVNILFEETFKKPIITEKTKEDVLKHPEKYSNCDVRIRKGMFYTDEEKVETEQQTFDVLAVPYDKPFVVESENVEEFKNTKANPEVIEQTEEMAEKFRTNNLGPVLKKTKKPNK